MVISIVAGPKFIDFLRRNEFGQQIREDGPQGHVVKRGTPAMGGLLIMLAMAIPFLAFSKHTLPALTAFFVTLGCAAIGFVDDWTKIARRRSLGLAGRWKLLWLAGITVIVGLVVSDRGFSTSVYVPLIDVDGYALKAMEHVRQHDPTGPLADVAALRIADHYFAKGD